MSVLAVGFSSPEVVGRQLGLKRIPQLRDDRGESVTGRLAEPLLHDLEEETLPRQVELPARASPTVSNASLT